MRSRLFSLPLMLGATVCSSSQPDCVSTATTPCTVPIDTTGGTTNVATGFVTKTVVVSGQTFAYQVFIPASYNASTAKIPIIAFMHGSGEKGSDNQKQLTSGLGPVVKSQEATFPAIVVFPQGPAGEDREGFKKITIAALDKTLSEYSKADASRQYLTGLSYGGIMNFEIAYASPTRFAAMVPISANICATCLTNSPTMTFAQAVQAAAQALKPLPIWQFHGERDAALKVADALAIKQAFVAAGNPYKLDIVDGGHEIWDGVYRDPAMWTWLYAQRR